MYPENGTVDVGITRSCTAKMIPLPTYTVQYSKN